MTKVNYDRYYVLYVGPGRPKTYTIRGGDACTSTKTEMGDALGAPWDHIPLAAVK